MLILLLVAGISWILQNFTFANFSLTTYGGNLRISIINAIILTLMLGICYLLFSPKSDIDRYEDIWDLDSIKIWRIVRVVVASILVLRIIMIKNETSFTLFNLSPYFFVIGVIILDIICIVVIDCEYSENLKMTLVDSFIMQIKDARSTVIVWGITAFCYHYTIVGTILILAIVCGIYNIIDYIRGL